MQPPDEIRGFLRAPGKPNAPPGPRLAEDPVAPSALELSRRPYQRNLVGVRDGRYRLNVGEIENRVAYGFDEKSEKNSATAAAE